MVPVELVSVWPLDVLRLHDRRVEGDHFSEVEVSADLGLREPGDQIAVNGRAE